MDRAEIEERLRGIVLKNSRVGARAVEAGHFLVQDTGLDSLALVRALAELEETLRITFPVERLEDPGRLTFGDLVEIVSAEVARGPR